MRKTSHLEEEAGLSERVKRGLSIGSRQTVAVCEEEQEVVAELGCKWPRS